MAFRIARDHVDVLYGDGDAERLDVHLVPGKVDDWNVLSGRYAIGKAAFIVDNWVLVQGLYASPANAAHYRSEELTTIYRRITFHEQPSGAMLVIMAPATVMRQHTLAVRYECLVAPARLEEALRLDERFAEATGPSSCARAARCCLSLRALNDAENHSLPNEICGGSADLSPRYCRSWQAIAVQSFENQWWVCDKDRQCHILDKPRHRDAPADCK